MSNPSHPTIVIRDIKRITEMRAVEELQKEVWGCSDRDIVPLMHLIPAIEVGGILIGAFDEETLVGFAYGFAGHEDGRLIIHSDMLAVSPAYRGCDVGYRLKLAQRERAIAQGISVMTWTFDPLQNRNAHLNFGKLGIVAGRYLINYYGEESSSVLHQNIGTDRLWARWSLKSERVKRRLAGEGRSKDIPSPLDEASKLVCVEADNSPRVNELDKSETLRHVLIEIPDDAGALQQNPLLAARWRKATRDAFCESLAAGYFVEEFYRSTEKSRAGGTYLLSRGKSVKDFD